MLKIAASISEMYGTASWILPVECIAISPVPATFGGVVLSPVAISVTDCISPVGVAIGISSRRRTVPAIPTALGGVVVIDDVMNIIEVPAGVVPIALTISNGLWISHAAVGIYRP